MSNYINKINIHEILESWKSSGLVTESSNIENFIANEKDEDRTPLYLKILSAVGAFFGSIFLLGFLSLIKVIRFPDDINSLGVGVGCIVLAVFLGRNCSKNPNSTSQTFIMQCSICFMGLGKLLFILGSYYLFKGSHDQEWMVSGAALLITVATYHIYPYSIDRFLSSLVVFISILINLDIEKVTKSIPVTDDFYFIFQILLAGFLFTFSRVRRIYNPVTYALVFSTFLTIAFKTYTNYHLNFYPLRIPNTILTLSLVYLIIWATADLKKIKSEPIFIAIVGAIFLGIVSDPGVLYSVCLLILGYARHDKILLAAGSSALSLSLIFYYYSMNLDFLSKSLVLIGSGLILLAGRYYLHFRKLDQESV